MSGKLVHFELSTQDPGQAAKFFGALFGWQPQSYGESYQFIDATPSGGLTEGQPGTTLVYFDVEDIEAAVSRVEELGGRCEQIEDLPGIGRSVHCHDDQGTAFSLFEQLKASGDR